jgi:DNA-binding PadR family transcriptional regulator
MTSDNNVTVRGARVLDALQTLESEGREGFDAARRAEPRFVDYLCKKVLGLLGTEPAVFQEPEPREVSNRPADARESAHQGAASMVEAALMPKQGDPNRIHAAGMRHKSITKKLADEFNSSKAVTRMTHLVILQHLLTQPREASVQTIFKELIEADLIGEDQRGSLVTSLNRLKKDKGFITWPDGKRGEEIKLTPRGHDYLQELKERKLQTLELDYIKKHASPSIRENLP